MNKLKRNEKYNVTLTGEQLAFIYLFSGNSNGIWNSKSTLYRNLDEIFGEEEFSIDIDIKDLSNFDTEINFWLDSLFAETPPPGLDLTK